MKRTINKPKKKSHKKKLEIKKNSKPLNKTKKDERNLTEVINKRYNSLIFIVIILYVVILGRVFYLQIIKENDYKESLAMATEKTVESTSAPRGRIYDRNYNLLVDNEGVKTIYYKKQNGITNKEEIELAYTVADNINLDYSKVNENRLKTFYYKGHYKECKKKITDKEWEEYNKRKLNDKDIEKLIYERLDEEISTYDERDKKAAYIYYLMNKGYSYAEKVIKNKDVSEEEYAYISENIDNLKGFNTKLDWERVYLYGDTFKSILGNVSSNNQGIPSELAEIYLKKGYSLDDRVGISYLEYQYENYLKGTKAKYRLLSDNSYELVSEGKRGSDIVLTIDINLQKHLEELPIESEHCSIREQDAQNCERDVDKMKKAEYMADHIGEIYEGIISGVQEFGIFVELENTVEGLIKAENIKGDYYVYDSDMMALIGKKTKKKYAFGDKITIRVVRADKDKSEIDFEVYDEKEKQINNKKKQK